jgi:hypothetical protein
VAAYLLQHHHDVPIGDA